MGAHSSYGPAPVNAHYIDAYFLWQKSVDELAEDNAWMFRGFVGTSDVVVDFGCGGGALLRCLDAQRRVGVEVNPAAIKHARLNGIEIVNDLLEMPPESVDVVISNHALELAGQDFKSGSHKEVADIDRRPGVEVLVDACRPMRLPSDVSSALPSFTTCAELMPICDQV